MRLLTRVVSKISKFSLLTSPLLFKFLTFCLRLKKSRPAFSAETVEPAGVRLRWATWLCTFGSLINWEKFSLEMWRYFLLNYSRRQTLPKTFSRTEQLNWSKQQAKCPCQRAVEANDALAPLALLRGWDGVIVSTTPSSGLEPD